LTQAVHLLLLTVINTYCQQKTYLHDSQICICCLHFCENALSFATHTMEKHEVEYTV